MMIRVVYTDGTFDMVKPQALDDLLERSEITSFKRSAGWAFVGKDAIRTSSNGYWGEERRAS